MHPQDIVGGITLILIGAFAAIYAATSLSIGTFASMGPGMFPVALGVILTGFGVLILVPALFRSGRMPEVDLRSALAISGAIFAFALLVRPFGLVPAIVALTAIVSRADSKLPLIGALGLAAALATGATLVFRVGLGMNVPAFHWPW